MALMSRKNIFNTRADGVEEGRTVMVDKDFPDLSVRKGDIGIIRRKSSRGHLESVSAEFDEGGGKTTTIQLPAYWPVIEKERRGSAVGEKVRGVFSAAAANLHNAMEAANKTAPKRHRKAMPKAAEKPKAKKPKKRAPARAGAWLD